ncbi:MAG TPA: hypothetical protein VGM67_13695 [Gemmatimonadaceae bacterium]|jgi:hypothetical protein
MRRPLLLLSLLVAPSIAVAQKGGGKTQATSHQELDTTRIPQGPTLRVRDVQDESPLKMFVDKHKDLKLTDPQVDSLKAADKALRDKNDVSYKSIDSLIGVMRSAARDQTDAGRGKSRVARAALMLAVGDVDTNNEAAAKEWVAKFTPEQQATATQLLTKLSEDEKHMLNDRLGGGRNGGGDN